MPRVEKVHVYPPGYRNRGDDEFQGDEGKDGCWTGKAGNKTVAVN